MDASTTKPNCWDQVWHYILPRQVQEQSWHTLRMAWLLRPNCFSAQTPSHPHSWLIPSTSLDCENTQLDSERVSLYSNNNKKKNRPIHDIGKLMMTWMEAHVHMLHLSGPTDPTVMKGSLFYQVDGCTSADSYKQCTQDGKHPPTIRFYTEEEAPDPCLLSTIALASMYPLVPMCFCIYRAI